MLTLCVPSMRVFSPLREIGIQKMSSDCEMLVEPGGSLAQQRSRSGQLGLHNERAE